MRIVLIGAVSAAMLAGLGSAMAQSQTAGVEPVRACADHYYAASHAAADLVWGNRPQSEFYSRMFNAFSDAGSLVERRKEARPQLCTATRFAELDAVVAKLEARRRALEAEQDRKLIESVGAGVDLALSEKDLP